MSSVSSLYMGNNRLVNYNLTLFFVQIISISHLTITMYYTNWHF